MPVRESVLVASWCGRGLRAALVVRALAGLSQATRIALTLMGVYGRL